MTTTSNDPQTTTESLGETAFVITRTFDAPRDLLFKVMTEAKHLVHWWGPRGFTMVSATVDLRPGGLFHYGMKGPDGTEMWGKFVYREIAEPERLSYVVSFSDPEANTTRAPFNQDWPLEVLNVMTFTENEGKTTIRIEGIPINATEAEIDAFASNHKSMQQGFTGTMNQLEEYLTTL